MENDVRDWIGSHVDEGGNFRRGDSHFKKHFGNEEGELPLEAGRYRLIWSPACPWANRSVIVRELLGLDQVISLGTVDPKRPDVPRSDWAFTLDPEEKDPVLGIHYLSEAYAKADPSYPGRFTVPAVIDERTGKVVNNDYYNLTLQWELEWKDFHKEGAPDLYPESLREQIDELNDILYDDINNGVYKAGFAESQEAYEKNFHRVFDRLDWLEERLSKQRFLFGDQITDSDIRLYVTLARFDAVYHTVFKLNYKRLRDYPNLWAYARDLYAIPAFGKNTHFQGIKEHYQLNCQINPYGLIAKGPDEEAWRIPSGRAEEFAQVKKQEKRGEKDA